MRLKPGICFKLKIKMNAADMGEKTKVGVDRAGQKNDKNNEPWGEMKRNRGARETSEAF